MDAEATYTSFAGDEHVVTGDLEAVLRASKARLDDSPECPLLIFDDATGRQVDFDLSGSADDVITRAVPAKADRGPGRPRLGVVSREVTLLPRHWDWLAEQPSGASAALRRLVDAARKNESKRDRSRRAAAATGRVITALAGDRPNFEEAYRALDAGDRDRFNDLIADWPMGVREHVLRLAEAAFQR